MKAMLNIPHTVFKTRALAEEVCRLMEPNEYRIKEDPTGTGKCLVEILDEDDGMVLGYL